MHTFHLLTHCLDLLVGSLQRRIVLILHQLWVNSLTQTFGHLSRSRPIHVLDEQVASNLPQARIALQDLRHSLHRLLTLGHVRRPSGDHYVVLANTRVVNLFKHNAGFILNLTHRLLLLRIDSDHAGFTVKTHDTGDTLRVVNLRHHIDDLPRDVPHATRKVVYEVICASVALTLTRKDRLA